MASTLDALRKRIEFALQGCNEIEELFTLAEVKAIAHGYAATIGGTQFGRTRTDEEDEEDSRRNLERVIEEVKEKR